MSVAQLIRAFEFKLTTINMFIKSLLKLAKKISSMLLFIDKFDQDKHTNLYNSEYIIIN